MAEIETHRPPAWLMALGGVVMALVAAGLVYALAIALRNFHQIGV